MFRSAVIVSLLALGVAACGSSHSNSSSPTTSASLLRVPTNTPQVAQARLQAAKCFRAHGINIPDFTAGAGRIRAALQVIGSYPTTKVQSVMQACYRTLRQAFPNALGANLNPTQLAQRRRAALVFAQCMRAHGVQYPDPSSNPLADAQALRSLDVNSPAFKSAVTACRPQALKVAG